MKPNGSRIYLRTLEVTDLDEEFMSWFSDADLMRYYTSSMQTITKEDLEKNILDGKKQNITHTYGIFLHESNACVGTLKLGPINWIHKISDLATLIGKRELHGKGFAVEAIKLGIQIAFQDFDLRKLVTGMYESNVSSIKAYTKAGWIIEGRLRGHYLEDGKPQDRILMGCFNPVYFS